MATATRPYYLVFNGTAYMVEATNPAAAVKHVVGAAITELRPARGAEVTAWHRQNKAVLIAGETATAAQPIAPAAVTVADAAADGVSQIVTPGFDLLDGEPREITSDDVVAWLVARSASNEALAAFGRVRSEQRMTLEHFDIIRAECPLFAIAMTTSVLGQDSALSIDDLRDHMQDKPLDLEVVLGAIAEDLEVVAAEEAAAGGLRGEPDCVGGLDMGERMVEPDPASDRDTI